MTQTFRNHTKKQNRICWMTDLHLDQANSVKTSKLLAKVEASDFDVAVITGDTSSSKDLTEHLAMLAKACGNRPLYITLGNHDYYQSSIKETKNSVMRLCSQITNLHHLPSIGSVNLGGGVALVGGDGWADGQWRGKRTKDIYSPDYYSIQDFQKMNQKSCYLKMRKLGRNATEEMRKSLKSLSREYRKIVIANHIPPYRTSALYDGKPCDADHQPHFVQATLGALLIGLATQHRSKEFTVLSGHTHNACRDQVLHNVLSIVGGCKKCFPQIQEIIAA